MCVGILLDLSLIAPARVHLFHFLQKIWGCRESCDESMICNCGAEDATT